MACATNRTDPLARAQARQTFWAGARCAAAALLGGELLVDWFEPYACVIALVLQHGSESAPPGVQHGLGHAGAGELLGVDVAHENRLMVFDQAR